MPKRRSKLAGHDERTIEVMTRSLDGILKETGQHGVDVVKLDVEGAELEVLKGARVTLSSSYTVLLIDVHKRLG